jgi:glycerol-1-phosphate dehydrogenase [NAD(P)+]
MDLADTGLVDHLGKTFDCGCGRTHTVDLDTVEISAAALDKVAEIIARHGFRRPFFIADVNTLKAAGQELFDKLTKENVSFSSYIFEDEQLVPDEYSMGRLLINFDPQCDLIVGIGSGTINDISRFFSHRLGLPYYIVATAPSMDGYASTGAALIVDNLKTTFECHMPKAIIADLRVNADAPQEMIAAGFSDLVGKYTCLADWQLSAIINDEYYCPTIVELTRQSVSKAVALRDGIASGDHGSIASLLEALVLSGIAMAYAGNSRPASGSEHHLSHFWEMRFLLEKKRAILHGTKVGIAAVLVAQLYEMLSKENIDAADVPDTMEPGDGDWEEEIKKAFLDAAPAVLLLEEHAQKNAPEGRRIRLERIIARWPEIVRVLRAVPSAAEVRSLISCVGGIVDPDEVGIGPDLVYSALLYAKEVRPRYTILQLLWDLGLLADYASQITNPAAA